MQTDDSPAAVRQETSEKRLPTSLESGEPPLPWRLTDHVPIGLSGGQRSRRILRKHFIWRELASKRCAMVVRWSLARFGCPSAMWCGLTALPSVWQEPAHQAGFRRDMWYRAGGTRTCNPGFDDRSLIGERASVRWLRDEMRLRGGDCAGFRRSLERGTGRAGQGVPTPSQGPERPEIRRLSVPTRKAAWTCHPFRTQSVSVM